MAKKDPFDDDEGGDDKAADRAAAESLKQKIEDKQEAAAGETELEIDVDKAEDELSELPASQRESRQQRKQNRYREMQEERDAAKREREQLSTRLAQMEQMLHAQRQPQGPPPPDKPSPLAEQRARLYQEQEMLYRDFSARQAQMSPEEVNAFNKRARELQSEMMETSAQIAVEKQGIRPVNEQEVRNQILREQLMREHGDVLSDPRMQEFCQGAWLQLRAKGRADDWSTIAEAAEATRRAFGRQTKTQKAPSESYKRKLTGMARGSGSGDGGAPTVVSMNGHQKSMADAAYKHIKDPAERYKRWAAGPGRRLLDKQTG